MPRHYQRQPRHQRPRGRRGEKGQGDAEVITPADSLTLEREESIRYEEVPATINARETTLIAARIMARIEKMAVDSGDRVERGD